MTRHWWVLVVLLVAFGIAGRIDYEAAQANGDSAGQLRRSTTSTEGV